MKQSNPPEEGPPVGPLYPELSEDKPASPQTFRLQKISELEAFLRAEVESRSCLNKKYRRAVNALDSTCGTLGMTCVTTGAVGAGLLASGIGFVPELALEVVTGAAGIVRCCLRCRVSSLCRESCKTRGCSCVGRVKTQLGPQPHIEGTGGLSNQ